MSYDSIDEIQKILADQVFIHAQAKKKAAGRALGTIVEIITYYLIRQWNLSSSVTIELRLPEFGNKRITHNVEFGLHPCLSCEVYELSNIKLPVTAIKLLNFLPNRVSWLLNFELTNNQLINSNLLQRNRCLIGKSKQRENHLFTIADILDLDNNIYRVEVSILQSNPFAIFECKRVGVEEGAKKGPTTIEKAKQGAYVAKHVSCLQKIRSVDGAVFSALAKPDGSFDIKPYAQALNHMIYNATIEELKNFVLTVGVASNHGNWFTSENPNKELLVLTESYDWLLFLTDQGLSQFIRELILEPSSFAQPVRTAFLETYDRPRTKALRQTNQFTKVRIRRDAHLVLIDYFKRNIEQIENEWFNVLSPKDKVISLLREQLHILANKNWRDEFNLY
ncbi:MAG: hypothetical protein ACOVQ7_19240 [Limnoraphis robusta]